MLGAGVVKFSVLIVVLAVMIHGIVRFLLYMDLNKRVYNHVPGGCTEVHGVQDGSVDMDLIKSQGTVIISSGLKLYNTTDLKNAKGTMYAYNVTGRSNFELSLDSKSLTSRNFNPHGISVWEDKEGKRIIVMVVNHRKKIDTVEIFRFKTKRNDKILTHIKTVKSPLFTNLRDVVAIDADRFYATNYHYFKRDTLQTLELYLGLRLGSVLYFDGKNTTTAQRWIGTPSGIALDKGKRYIYVSSLSGESLIVYKIAKDGNLTKFDEIPLYTSPENIFVDPWTADLYVGCHPIKNRIFRYESAPKSIYTPSQVLKLRGRPAKSWSISEIYANDGATLSGSSIAVKMKDTLLIGSLHDKMLNCDLEAAELL